MLPCKLDITPGRCYCTAIYRAKCSLQIPYPPIPPTPQKYKYTSMRQISSLDTVVENKSRHTHKYIMYIYILHPQNDLYFATSLKYSGHNQPIPKASPFPRILALVQIPSAMQVSGSCSYNGNDIPLFW